MLIKTPNAFYPELEGIYGMRQVQSYKQFGGFAEGPEAAVDGRTAGSIDGFIAKASIDYRVVMDAYVDSDEGTAQLAALFLVEYIKDHFVIDKPVVTAAQSQTTQGE